MIYIDTYIHNIWKKNKLTKQEMKNLIKICFEETKKHADNIFLNVNFVNEQTIIKYNYMYRGKNTSTNVLSFENKDVKNMKNLYLGEMMLCYEKIVEESKLYNKSFKERLYHLFVHSILHLLGYDHINIKERNKMEKLEKKILLHFNIKDPYFI